MSTAAFAAAIHSHTAADLPIGSTSAPGVLQLLDSVTSNSTTMAAVPKSVKEAFDKGDEALTKATTADNKVDQLTLDALTKNGGTIEQALVANLVGLLIKTPTGRRIIELLDTEGSVAIGGDNRLILGAGEAVDQIKGNTTGETAHLGSDTTAHIYTNLQNGWANRKEFIYEDDGGFKPANPTKTRQNLNVPSIEQAIGRKNLLINGDFRINQRSFSGDWSTLNIGDYGYDRWKKHANGIEQIIEGGWFAPGTYYLSWQGGTGSGAVDGVTVTNGSAMTITDNSQSISVVVPDNATLIQFERENASAFEYIHYATELALCQRYYFRDQNWRTAYLASSNGVVFRDCARFPVSMRVKPTITYLSLSDGGYGGSITPETDTYWH